MKSIFPFAHLFVAAFLTATAVSAAEPATSFVRLHAIDLLEGALTPTQATKLQLIAHQAAIAASCDGITLDDAKVSKAFEELKPENEAQLKPEQIDYHEKHILVIYGILIGGELAAISDDVSDACAQAAKTKVDADFATQNVWQ